MCMVYHSMKCEYLVKYFEIIHVALNTSLVLLSKSLLHAPSLLNIYWVAKATSYSTSKTLVRWCKFQVYQNCGQMCYLK